MKIQIKLFIAAIFQIVFFSFQADAKIPSLMLTERQHRYELGTYLEYLEDPGKAFTIRDVSSPEYDRQFIPNQKEELNFGLSRGAYWVRFHIRNAVNTAATWLLELGDPRLNIADIYIPLGDHQEFEVNQYGYYSPSEREFKYRNFIFRLPIAPHQEQTIYLRIESVIIQTPLTIWSFEAFQRKTSSENLLFGLFYGGLAIIWAYHVFLWVILRERSYFYYLLFMFGFILLNLGDDGLGNLYFWNNFQYRHLLFPIVSVLINISLLLFTADFLKTRQFMPGFHRIMMFLVPVWGILPLFYCCIPKIILIEITYYFSLLTFLIMSLSGFLIWQKGFRPARYYLLSWGVFFIMASLGTCGILNILSVGYIFTSLILKSETLIQTLLFSLSLADRISTFRQETETAQALSVKAVEENERLVREQNTLLEQQVEERTRDLKISESRYRRLFDDSPISMWEEDFSKVNAYIDTLKQAGIQDFRAYFDEHPEELLNCISMASITDVNNRTLELYHAENKAELFNNLGAVFQQASLEGMKQALISLACGNRMFEGEAVNYKLTGEPMHLLVRSFDTSENNKPFSKILVCMVDITARKKAEEELRQSELKHRLITETSEDVIWMLDNEYRFTYISPSIQRLTGFTPEEAMKQSVQDTMTPGSFQVVLQKTEKIQEEERKGNSDIVQCFDIEIYCKDGSTVWVEIVTKPILNHEGKRQGHVGVSRNVTKRKQIEDLLINAKNAAESANHAKSRFLANMSHELRTPLNAVLGYAQLLQKDSSVSEFQKERIKIIQKSGEHLLSLINDILDLSKIEAGRMELEFSEFEFPVFLSNLSAMFYIRAANKKILFTYHVLSSLPQIVSSDEKRLSQILINLIGNAIKFTRSGGVTFNVSYDDGYAFFQVKDTGTGIESDDLEKIFSPFYQAPRVPGTEEGTGLGLSICKKLTEIMGGTLTVQSTPGKGSVFEVRMPLSSSESKQEFRNIQLSPITGYHGQTKKILIADDNVMNRSLLADILTPFGFEIVEADNGQTAVLKAKQYQPELVLMDLFMPVMDGFEAVRQIRAAFPNTAIFAVSAGTFQEHIQRSKEAGCNDFISKPVRSEELLNKIKQHLAIEWIYGNPELIETGTAGLPLIPPSDDIIDIMISSIRIGDITAVIKQADALIQGDEKFRAFGKEIHQLAKSFQIGKIRKFLTSFKNNPNG